MLNKDESKQQYAELVIIDNLVPENHLVRKIDKVLNYSFIRKQFESFYCEDNGRPAIDPVILFKIYLLGFLFGVRSERQLIRDIEVNIAYRWFLGYSLTDSIPNHSTLSKNRIHRFKGNELFRNIFNDTVFLAIQKRLVSGKTLYTDSTHLKANANKKKFDKKLVKQATKDYLDDLEKDVNEDRTEHGKKPLKELDNSNATKETRVSTTDPESGFLMRNGKEECFAYLDHRTVDSKFNIITDVHVTPGNYHDSICYISRLDHQINQFGFDVQNVGLDAGYFTTPLCHGLKERNVFGALGYRRPSGRKGFIRKKEFKYDKDRDVYICPKGQILQYRTTSRNGYSEYISKADICKKCGLLKICTENKNCIKSISRHVWEEDKEEMDKNRLTDKGKAIYKKRKETVERSFADAKQLHGYRYARYRGILGVEFQCLMTAIAQNLKKIASIVDKEIKNTTENTMQVFCVNILCFWGLYKLVLSNKNYILDKIEFNKY